MKKITSIILAVIMMLALGSVAFAEPAAEAPTFNIPVYYIFPTGYEGAKKPAETFTLAVTPATPAQSGAPTVTAPAALAFAGGTNQEDVKFGVFTITNITKPGVFDYTITQTASHDYAGMVYDTKTANLTLYIVADEDTGELKAVPIVKYDDEKVNGGKYDEDKKDYVKNTEDGSETSEALATFTNIYKAAAKDPSPSGTNVGLSIKKTVKGNMGDRNKEFTVKVSFSSAKVLADAISYVDGESKSLTLAKGDGDAYVGEATITLKHGETVTFDNVPEGVSYVIKENDYSADGYETAYKYNDVVLTDGQEKPTNLTSVAKTVDAASINVEIVNTNGIDGPDTGVILESLPYVIILAFVAAGVAMIIVKKRKSEEF